VSVDFGKARQVFFGKSPLTKAITSGAFGVSTVLTMDQVRDAAALTCKEYPVKKRFLQSMAPRIVQRKSGQQVIAYGALTQRRTASGGSVETVLDNALDVQWELALGAGLPGYACVIILARYTERSGKIDEVEELQYFLNELERNLRVLDPRAEISLTDRKRQ
jgi:hypothetical protein